MLFALRVLSNSNVLEWVGRCRDAIDRAFKPRDGCVFGKDTQRIFACLTGLLLVENALCLVYELVLK